MTLTKDFRDGLLSINDQSDFQAFLYQSKKITREMSRPGTGEQRLPKLSECISKAIKYTPTTLKKRDATGNTQMGPQEHLIRNHEYPPKGHVTHTKCTLIHNTNPHDTHLTRHPVPHQDSTYTRYLGKKIDYFYQWSRN